MKLLVSLFVLVTNLGLAVDADTIKASIVKIVSIGQPISTELRGSGVLFSKDGKYYVITSDHVVVHVNMIQTTHVATSSHTGEKFSLKFLASEWGLGLTLLEVEGKAPSTKTLTFEDLEAPAKASVGDKISFYGYPYESEELTEESEAKVLNFEAPLPYYVHIPKLYEFDALIGEFGMSGGGAFTSQGNFLGILAYQKILNAPLETGNNRVYSLPPKTVLDWLKHYFKEGVNYKPIFSEPWWAQQHPEQVAFTNDGYVFFFRAFDGVVRMAILRMEALLVLSDIATHHYEDTRGIMKAMRADVDKTIFAPAEFSIVDRTNPKPVLVEINYPASAIVAMSKPGFSSFLARGERHQQRYARFKPLVGQLSEEIASAKKKVGTNSEKAWVEMGKELDTLLERLNAIPPNPTLPEPEGHSEFFSSHWIGNTFLLFEAHETMEGWKYMESKAPNETSKIRETYTKLREALNAVEFSGTP